MEEEQIEDQEPWYKGPMKWILSLALILMLLLWLIPTYGVRLDPHPSYIPGIGEVITTDIIANESHFTSISLDMVDGADPVIKETADKIVVKACNNGGKICHSKALFYFVRDNFEYVSDPTAYEYVKTAKQTLVSGGQDCDDASVLLANLLDAIGVKTRFVFIPGHVFIQAELPKALNKYKFEDNWVNLDATCSNCEFGQITYSVSQSEKRYLG